MSNTGKLSKQLIQEPHANKVKAAHDNEVEDVLERVVASPV